MNLRTETTPGGTAAHHPADPDGVEATQATQDPQEGQAATQEAQDGVTKSHPIANIWPLLPERELRELAEDIKANGLRNPIWRHRDGRIIDGRNRYLACRIAGVECRHEVYEGEDGPELISFIVSLNEKRRHLSTDQRAAIAADLATLAHGSNRHEAKVEGSPEPSTTALTEAAAAKLMAVSESSVKRQKKLKRADPELHEKVRKGEVKAGKARAEVAKNKGTAATPAKKKRKTKPQDPAAAPPATTEEQAAPESERQQEHAPTVEGTDAARPPPTGKARRLLKASLLDLCREFRREHPDVGTDEIKQAVFDAYEAVAEGALDEGARA
jgi:ParB-like chromosome segregation protein Spo0J